MSQVDPRGRFVWHELLTLDSSSAIDFYTRVVGWGTTVWEGAGQPYTMWTRGDSPLGGTMKLPETAQADGAPPHWLPYLGTPDVDGTVARAGELGANIMCPPTDIASVGRFAVLTDPQEALFAVFESESGTPGGDEPAAIGEFSWHELLTTDWAAAFEFYRDLFGWEKTEAMDMGELGTYQMYGLDGSTLGGMFNKPVEMPAPSHWLCYVRVDDVHRRAAIVEELGGQVLNGPMEVPGGDMIAQCVDPQGAGFAIHSSAAAADS
ncbi:MAG: VOC family protein [Gemmatimonadota bacterium]